MEVAMMSNNIRESATANNPTVLVPISPCNANIVNSRKEVKVLSPYPAERRGH